MGEGRLWHQSLAIFFIMLAITFTGAACHRHEQAMVSEPLEGVLCPNIQPRQRRSKFFCSPDNKTPGVELALSGCWWGKLVA